MTLQLLISSSSDDSVQKLRRYFAFCLINSKDIGKKSDETDEYEGIESRKVLFLIHATYPLTKMKINTL